MSKTLSFLISFSNIRKAEIFAFFNLVLLLFWLLEFLTSTTRKSESIQTEDWNGLLGFFMSYLMPMFMGVFLWDGVRYKNGIMCKLWLIYQLAVLLCCGFVLFMADQTFTMSSRKMIIIVSTIIFKTIGMWIVLDFVRELDDRTDYVVTLIV